MVPQEQEEKMIIVPVKPETFKEVIIQREVDTKNVTSMLDDMI